MSINETHIQPMLLQITEMPSKFLAYETRLDNMSFNNISKFETATREIYHYKQHKILIDKHKNLLIDFLSKKLNFFQGQRDKEIKQ